MSSGDGQVTVCIPSIPRRMQFLDEAVRSVESQTRPGVKHVVEVDTVGLGAARNRNAALARATTEWVAFLDDDDLLYPEHVERCLERAEERQSDLVYPWFDLLEGVDPLSVNISGKYVTPFGLEFGPEHETHLRKYGNFIPITVLVRRELIMDVGGFPQPGTDEWSHTTCEDWGCWLRLLDAGARFDHVPHKTWRWRWHRGNTSGRPWK